MVVEAVIHSSLMPDACVVVGPSVLACACSIRVPTYIRMGNWLYVCLCGGGAISKLLIGNLLLDDLIRCYSLCKTLVSVFHLCMQTVPTHVHISCYDDGTEIVIAILMHKLQNTCTRTHATLQSWLLYLEYTASALECQEEKRSYIRL